MMTRKKKGPKLDMNPVVDVAFLLLIFFILTTTLKTAEPYKIDNPTSFAENKLPEYDIMIITVTDDGRIFFNLDGKYNRQKVLALMMQKYGLSCSDNQIQKFSLLSSFGVPVHHLPNYLNLNQKERMEYQSNGIPCDSLNNQLADWIKFTRMVNPKVRVALNGDEYTLYPKFKKIVNTLLDLRIQRFNLITNLEEKKES